MTLYIGYVKCNKIYCSNHTKNLNIQLQEAQSFTNKPRTSLFRSANCLAHSHAVWLLFVIVEGSVVELDWTGPVGRSGNLMNRHLSQYRFLIKPFMLLTRKNPLKLSWFCANHVTRLGYYNPTRLQFL